MIHHGEKIRTKHEDEEGVELSNYTKEKLLSFPTKVNNNNNISNSLGQTNLPNGKLGQTNNNNNKKKTNKSFCCPFTCPNCQLLGGDLVKSKYEIVNIVSDTEDSIFSPMHERYYNDDDDGDHRSRIRNGGKVFLSADLVVDSFFQQNFKK